MKIPAQLRTNSAFWSLLPTIVLIILYYDNGRPLQEIPHYGYAPSIISYKLSPFYAPLAYAAASSLAAWESGSLKKNGVWSLAPVRRRARIASQRLIPVLVLSWMAITIPTAAALVETGVAPTAPSLLLPIMAMFVAMAHTLIGFGLGLVLPRLIIAPILAVGVFFGVAASWSSGTVFWPRHVMGQFPTELMFGELPTLISLTPHLLFTGSIAVAVLLWILLSRKNILIGLTLAAVVATSGTLTSYNMVVGWRHNPDLSTGNVAVTCIGHQPRVCMPETTADGKLPNLQNSIVATLGSLSETGVDINPPTTVKDLIMGGRFRRSSTTETWYLPLTSAPANWIRYKVTSRAVLPSCEDREGQAAQRLILWATGITDTDDIALARQKEEAFLDSHKRQLAESVDRVKEVRALPEDEQLAWYRATKRKACPATPSGQGGR